MKQFSIEQEISSIEKVLKSICGSGFDFSRWDSLQKPVMRAILKEKSQILALMPTGSGKSFLYQYFALFRNDVGITIVIEPLQSIIQDQCEKFNNLSKKMGLKARAADADCCLTEDITVFFLSPEQIFRNDKWFYNLIKDGTKIQMIVVDEVHTLFEWGEAFRSEFLYIPYFVNRIREYNHELRFLALTATLTKAEIELCKWVFNIGDNEIIGELPSFSSDRMRITRFTSIGRINDANDELMSVIVGSYRKGMQQLDEGIAFFKKKSGINSFLRHLKEVCGNNSKYQLDNKQKYVTKMLVPQVIGGQIWGEFKRYILEFKGILNASEKENLIKYMSHAEDDEFHSYECYVLATKAIAMGVDFPSFSQVQIIGIPESWGCFLQEIGRLRKVNDTSSIEVFYSSADAINTLRNLIESVSNNPACICDYLANAMERMIIWDYLCLWEWFIDSMPNGPISSIPQDIDISLDDLLSIRSQDIRRKLNNIVEKDYRIKRESINLNGFDPVFECRIKKDDKIPRLFALNDSRTFISYSQGYSGIFNGGKGLIVSCDPNRWLKADSTLNFFDFIVFNAICTHYSYSSERVDAVSILMCLLGIDEIEDEDRDSPYLKHKNSYRVLLECVENSLRKIETTKVFDYTVKTRYPMHRNGLALYEYSEENKVAHFPFFDEYREIQNSIIAIESSRIRYLFEECQGRGKSLTTTNIIAIYYTIYGIHKSPKILPNLQKTGEFKSVYVVEERHSPARGEYSVNGTIYKDSYERNAIGIPYAIPAIDSALTDWIIMNDGTLNESNDSKRIIDNRKKPEYQRLRKKMKKILVLEMCPNIYGYSDNEINEKYVEIAQKSFAKGTNTNQNRKEDSDSDWFNAFLYGS